jgi:ferrous iron transport protein B
MCRTEEEKVTRNLLLSEQPKIVLHVVDAKNIQRMLPLTFQFIESDLPVILVLNIMDEAIKAGLKIDIKGLEKELGIPVVPTAAALNVELTF